MKLLLQRTKADSNRFTQSFQSFGQITEARNKLYATTSRNSFYTRIEKQDNKLPHLSRSFSSSNAKNAKQKVTDFGDRVADLQKKVHQLRLQTRESRRFASFLKQDLGERQLGQHRHNLLQKIITLDKFAKVTKQINEQKTSTLKQDCQKLNDFSIQLKKLLLSISDRVDSIQNTMGVYSGKEKHKI